VRNVPQIIGTLVISRDSKALSIARDYDAKTIQETGTPELNSALTRATQVIASWGVESLLVLPADLPLVNSDDLMDMISMGRGGPSVVIATDQNQDGTNALFMRPPGIIPYAYGPGSYQRHVALARSAGVKAKTFFSEHLSLDIDVSGDLDIYNRLAKEANQPQLFVSD
jgi:2-phospho-L-lactate guanylyltransferase